MSKPTSTEEKVVVTGAIVAGLIFFGFVTKTCQNPFDRSEETDATIAALGSSADNSEDEARIAELESRIETLRENSDDQKTIADLEDKLAAQEKKVQVSSGAAEEQVEGLEDRIAELSGSSAEAGGTSQVSDLDAKLKLSESNREELAAKLSAMSTAASGETDQLAARVKALGDDNEKLANELSKMKSGMPPVKMTPNVDKDMAGKMKGLMETTNSQKELIEKQKGQIVELGAQLNQLKAAKNVFVESADDLPDKAKGLFADLNTLEGKSEDEVQAAYAQYLEKHGATAKERIQFRSGSSALTEDDRKKIASLTEEADKNSYFFIVGYADQSGNAAGNKKLSSARSTSVAKELAKSAKGFQSAQAVYLGQTNRFGASAENRVVEIWEIK